MEWPRFFGFFGVGSSLHLCLLTCLGGRGGEDIQYLPSLSVSCSPLYVAGRGFSVLACGGGGGGLEPAPMLAKEWSVLLILIPWQGLSRHNAIDVHYYRSDDVGKLWKTDLKHCVQTLSLTMKI